MTLEDQLAAANAEIERLRAAELNGAGSGDKWHDRAIVLNAQLDAVCKERDALMADSQGWELSAKSAGSGCIQLQAELAALQSRHDATVADLAALRRKVEGADAFQQQIGEMSGRIETDQKLISSQVEEIEQLKAKSARDDAVLERATNTLITGANTVYDMHLKLESLLSRVEFRKVGSGVYQAEGFGVFQEDNLIAIAFNLKSLSLVMAKTKELGPRTIQSIFFIISERP